MTQIGKYRRTNDEWVDANADSCIWRISRFLVFAMHIELRRGRNYLVQRRFIDDLFVQNKDKKTEIKYTFLQRFSAGWAQECRMHRQIHSQPECRGKLSHSPNSCHRSHSCDSRADESVIRFEPHKIDSAESEKIAERKL